MFSQPSVLGFNHENTQVNGGFHVYLGTGSLLEAPFYTKVAQPYEEAASFVQQ